MTFTKSIHLKIHLCKIFIPLILLLVLFSKTIFAVEIPELKGRVNDYAKMMSPETNSAISKKLEDFEKKESTQIVVLTIDSLEGSPIEDFAIKVAEKWKIGQEKKDNGLILIIGKNDRRMRIEVGRGLEGKITDLLAGRIIDTIIYTEFKKGNFDSGFTKGTDALILAAQGEFKPNPQLEKSNETKTENETRGYFKLSPSASETILIVMTVLLFMILPIVSSFSKKWGAISGAVSLPLSYFFFAGPNFTGIFELIFIAVLSITGFTVLWIIGIISSKTIPGKSSYNYSSSQSTMNNYRENKSNNTGTNKSRSSSGGGSSFSGGGGSFSGGGASGGW